VARDFKEFIRISGMTHVRTGPYYPQSNGKIERWHRTLKGECIRVKTPLSLDDAHTVAHGAEHELAHSIPKLGSVIVHAYPAHDAVLSS